MSPALKIDGVSQEAKFRVAVLQLVGHLVPKEVPLEVRFVIISWLFLVLIGSFVIVIFLVYVTVSISQGTHPSCTFFLVFYSGVTLAFLITGWYGLHSLKPSKVEKVESLEISRSAAGYTLFVEGSQTSSTAVYRSWEQLVQEIKTLKLSSRRLNSAKQEADANGSTRILL